MGNDITTAENIHYSAGSSSGSMKFAKRYLSPEEAEQAIIERFTSGGECFADQYVVFKEQKKTTIQRGVVLKFEQITTALFAIDKNLKKTNFCA